LLLRRPRAALPTEIGNTYQTHTEEISPMRTLLTTLALSLLLPTVSLTEAAASQPCIGCMKKPFKAMKQALAKKDAKTFAKQWHPKGYAKNLVGGSGLAGRSVYRQGSRKGWYLEPDFSKLRGVPGRRGGPWIVPCKVWSPRRNRAVDMIWALMVYHAKRSVVLGGGEKLKEVEALGVRWVAKKPLAPPKKKR
jgi:hypothetical protein